jgi:hypothetical protein
MTTTYNKICKLYKSQKIKGKYIITTNIDKLKRINYMKNNKTIKNNKPYGFWFSVGDEWIRYLCENEFENIANKYNYIIISIKINTSTILIVKKYKDIEKYVKNNNINWKLLFNGYDGIIVKSNDIYDSFSDIGSLFYGWDIKSGVIWKNVNKYVEYKNVIKL